MEFEDSFDEFHKALESKDVPFDLRVLWARPSGLPAEHQSSRPFQYSELVVHWDMSAMTVRKDAASTTGWEELDPLRIPPPPHSVIAMPDPPTLLGKNIE
ncbi:MAG: hypothetical protein F4Z77_11325 [Dehalococcoidia bacterium]|nr:hypothetical protein [Dehalococcoidia bacterium]MYA53831.1 hypothetical protein [Dehalococcoidia bacterium]